MRFVFFVSLFLWNNNKKFHFQNGGLTSRESERGCEKGRIGGTFEGMEIIKAGWSTTEDWKKFMV